jgi:NAD(P)-dependent dehydrogenase (short-subunit alcohol dehydrogenase family)
MAVKDYTTTADGIELQFGANHIGHFLLTNLLMDKILAAGKGARVINVSSFGYMGAGVRFDDWDFNASTFFESA